MKNARIAYLDSLRGLAALCVACLFHYSHFSSAFQPASLPLSDAPLWSVLPVRIVYQYGGSGVDLFFVLSGIIFSHKYADVIRSGAMEGRRFFVYRFSRLYPLHFVTLIVVGLLVWWFNAINGRFPIYQNNDLKHLLLNIAFLQFRIADLAFSFNGPAWSLTIEAVMYALFWYSCRSRKSQYWWLLFFLVGLGATLLERPWPVFNAAVGRGMLGFFMGCFILKVDKAGASRRALKFAVVVLGTTFLAKHFLYPALPSVLIILPAFACLLLLINISQPLRRMLDTRPLRFLGDISLSVYLVHIPVQIAILLLLQHLRVAIPFADPLFLGAYAGVVISVGTITHYSIELPAQSALRKRLNVSL